METVYTEDNVPQLEDYLEYLQQEKGTVYVCVEINTPAYAGGHVHHLEIYNRPPTFEFADHGQKCFVGNINGGDSMQFNHLAALMVYLNEEYEVWLVEQKHNVNLQEHIWRERKTVGRLGPRSTS